MSTALFTGVYLCDLLAELIRANGNKVGTVGITWWSAADRLMRLDGYTREGCRGE